jgi:hypothetical protein
MDRPRRRLGCWIAIAAVVVLLFAGWLLLPRLLCLVANTSLPRELGEQATLLALDPAAQHLPRAPIVLLLDPVLMRRIASEASGRWIPPGIIRHGFGAVGTVRGAGNLAIGWQVAATDGVIPPRLMVTLTPIQANALLASASGGAIAGMSVTPQLHSLELAALPDDGANRRFRVEAAGALRLSTGSVSVDIPIRRLIAQVTVEFTPAAGGWEPSVQLQIDVLEAPLPPIPGIEPGTWRKLLGNWAQERIASQLSGRTVPAWFPIDISLSAVVR